MKKLEKILKYLNNTEKNFIGEAATEKFHAKSDDVLFGVLYIYDKAEIQNLFNNIKKYFKELYKNE